MSKELFAGRYELLEEAPMGAGGRLFEARDTNTGESVAVKVFRQQLPPSTSERADLDDVFRRAERTQHPHLVRFHALSLDEGYLVREWVHGFSLLVLLRKRREMPGEEAICLLEGIAEALDLSVAQGLAPGGDLLTRLFVGFGRDVPADQMTRLRGEPVSKWPDFLVKLNPLRVDTFLPTDEEDAMNTMVNVRPKTSAVVSPPGAFALMLYELLGGPHLSGLSPRYTPLSALNEQGNAVLRRAIESRRPPATCQALWTELLAESALQPARKKVTPPPLPKRRQLRIPETLIGNVQPGTMLKITPSDLTYVPMHLIARPRFRIGRSLYQADFITRVLPETPDNEKLTKELGRVHIIVDVKGDALHFHDGNGEQPSVNGSSFCDVPLSAEHPVVLDRAGLLALYKNYELDVRPLFGAADLGWEIVNEKDWSGPNTPPPTVRGAVIFTPRRGQPILRKAVWLFTRLDFTLSTQGEITWVEAGSPQSEAAFFHHRGQFWVANFSLKVAPAVGGIALTENTAAPLVSGQVLTVGPGRYTIEVQ